MLVLLIKQDSDSIVFRHFSKIEAGVQVGAGLSKKKTNKPKTNSSCNQTSGNTTSNNNGSNNT